MYFTILWRIVKNANGKWGINRDYVLLIDNKQINWYYLHCVLSWHFSQKQSWTKTLRYLLNILLNILLTFLNALSLNMAIWNLLWKSIGMAMYYGVSIECFSAVAHHATPGSTYRRYKENSLAGYVERGTIHSIIIIFQRVYIESASTSPLSIDIICILFFGQFET